MKLQKIENYILVLFCTLQIPSSIFVLLVPVVCQLQSPAITCQARASHVTVWRRGFLHNILPRTAHSSCQGSHPNLELNQTSLNTVGAAKNILFFKKALEGPSDTPDLSWDLGLPLGNLAAQNHPWAIWPHKSNLGQLKSHSSTDHHAPTRSRYLLQNPVMVILLGTLSLSNQTKSIGESHPILFIYWLSCVSPAVGCESVACLVARVRGWFSPLIWLFYPLIWFCIDQENGFQYLLICFYVDLEKAF